MKKIYLFCANGLSTSMLVKKMKDAAVKNEFECEIVAHPVSEAKTLGKEADMILLGPQIRFQLAKVQEDCPGVPVETIDMRNYGSMNGEAIIKHVMDVVGK